MSLWPLPRLNSCRKVSGGALPTQSPLQAIRCGLGVFKQRVYTSPICPMRPMHMCAIVITPHMITCHSTCRGVHGWDLSLGLVHSSNPLQVSTLMVGPLLLIQHSIVLTSIRIVNPSLWESAHHHHSAPQSQRDPGIFRDLSCIRFSMIQSILHAHETATLTL